jgi:hypothetical protein
MKLPSFLAYTALLLPLIKAELAINILAPSGWEDLAMVKGKNTSDGNIEEMTRAINNPDSGSLCPNADYGPNCKKQYYGMTTIYFSRPTEDPRSINITLPTSMIHNITIGYSLQVSQHPSLELTR